MLMAKVYLIFGVELWRVTFLRQGMVITLIVQSHGNHQLGLMCSMCLHYQINNPLLSEIVPSAVVMESPSATIPQMIPLPQWKHSRESWLDTASFSSVVAVIFTFYCIALICFSNKKVCDWIQDSGAIKPVQLFKKYTIVLKSFEWLNLWKIAFRYSKSQPIISHFLQCLHLTLFAGLKVTGLSYFVPPEHTHRLKICSLINLRNYHFR